MVGSGERNLKARICRGQVSVARAASHLGIETVPTPTHMRFASLHRHRYCSRASWRVRIDAVLLTFGQSPNARGGKELHPSKPTIRTKGKLVKPFCRVGGQQIGRIVVCIGQRPETSAEMMNSSRRPSMPVRRNRNSSVDERPADASSRASVFRTSSALAAGIENCGLNDV